MMKRRATGKAFPKVIIVGCGFGGIAAGVKLKRAGIDFTILEQSDGPGGTWRDNQYPGAEVDVDSVVYSFSFKSSDWTRTHARQPELLRYIEEALDDFGLREHCRFNTKVERAVWNEDDHTYSVELNDGGTLHCNVLISAVGLLNHPRYPDWPGLEDFKGPKFHTARWEGHHELAGKRVAIVGTGSTASQIVPNIASEVAQVTLFQREPGWVIPKGDRDLTPEERAERRNELRRRWSRIKYLTLAERSQIRASAFRPGTKTNTLREQICREHIATVFKDRPDLAEAVTPSYPYGGKRNIINGDFYPALLLDNVRLVPHAVVSVTEDSVVDATGAEHPADVLVMSTGFQPANFLATFEVIGKNGQSLREAWDGEPRAFLGITVPGFPNFYMLYGPNTNGGEIMSNLERQGEYAIRRILRMARSNITAIEVKKSYYDRYNWWLQRSLANTVWTLSNNYYKSSSGRIVTQWPYGPLTYGALTKFLGANSEVVSSKGRDT